MIFPEIFQNRARAAEDFQPLNNIVLYFQKGIFNSSAVITDGFVLHRGVRGGLNPPRGGFNPPPDL